MKKTFILFLCLAGTLFNSGKAVAQSKPETKIVSVKQNETVDFNLVSSRCFIAGGNVYILNIGDKEFGLSKDQSCRKGKGYITFIVPKADFNSLKEGESMYVTYGKVFRKGQDRAEIAQQHPRVWDLGKFSKQLMTK